MTTYTIADLIFWGCLASVAVFIYQGIILPGIRLSLRYRVFELRDRLRRLVIEGKLEESDRAFQVLHDRLNFMCVSLARLDLARVIQASSKLDEESRTRVATYIHVMESAPDDVKKIYKESLQVTALALTCNSLFIFVISVTCLLVFVAVKSGFRHVKELFWRKVDADTTVAFFSPELATV
jgi:hypothetical protein